MEKEKAILEKKREGRPIQSENYIENDENSDLLSSPG